MDEVLERLEILTPGAKRILFPFPSEPTDEELARDWLLSEDEIAFICKQARGKDSKLRVAIQLTVLRNYGRFLDDFHKFPIRIANSLSGQLNLPPVMLIDNPLRVATEVDQKKRIRKFLGFVPFDDGHESNLEKALKLKITEGVSPKDLYYRAEDILRSWKVILPAPSTIERLVGSAYSVSIAELFENLTRLLPPEVRTAFDELLLIEDDKNTSFLYWLKEYPPAASPDVICAYIKRFKFIESIYPLAIQNLSGVNPTFISQLALMTRKYDVSKLRRFKPEKRYSLIACFLSESQKTLLDHIVALNDQMLIDISRRARNSYQKKQKEMHTRLRKGMDTAVKVMEIIIDPTVSKEKLAETIAEKVKEEEIKSALSACREYTNLEDRGWIMGQRARYTQFKQYFCEFLELPFQFSTGNGALANAVDTARQIYTAQQAGHPPPPITDTDFLDPSFRDNVRSQSGVIDSKIWEIGLAHKLKSALRSGNAYLPQSKKHVSFWNLVYKDSEWEEARSAAYEELHLSPDFKRVVETLKKEFDEAIDAAERHYHRNKFVEVRNGELRLKRKDALKIPESTKNLRRVIEANMPQIRIEDLLYEVDLLCGYSKELRTLPGYDPRPGENQYGALLATLIAHGTNLGVVVMGNNSEGMSKDILQRTSKSRLREETLKGANREIVNYHHGLPISANWGPGTFSSSDGQKFRMQKKSLHATFHPHYFGPFDKGITILTHTSDQFSVFKVQVLSCAVREAVHLLDGLLDNDTALRPREHTSDTHGYTEHIFALCYLLGFSFMPRIRDIKDQRLYKVDASKTYKHFEPLFCGAVDLDLIGEQWDQFARIAASLRNKTAPAHVVVERLANGTDRLSKALKELGKLIKTIFILRYLDDETLRDKIQLQLNRGEARHALARYLFFANQGEFKTRDYSEIMNKASCLSLLSNAVLLWNSVQMQKIIDNLESQGHKIDRKDIARISPLMHRHINPTGVYSFQHIIERKQAAR